MLKSIWNKIVDLGKAIKGLWCGYAFNSAFDASLRTGEEEVLMAGDKFSWIKWFQGNYAFEPITPEEGIQIFKKGSLAFALGTLFGMFVLFPYIGWWVLLFSGPFGRLAMRIVTGIMLKNRVLPNLPIRCELLPV